MENGQLEIYTGFGKGKTTAAFGVAVRALGHGMTVYIGQFIKDLKYGEVLYLQDEDNITIDLYGTGSGCLIDRDAEDKDYMCASNGVNKIIEAISSKQYDVVIADEIITAYYIKILGEDRLLEIVDACNKNTEVIMTGIGAPQSLISKADLVSEMKEIKHYYKSKGLLARDGIER